jgi:hypothetical protein
MGGLSIESGKHHYHSQQGSSKWLCSSEINFFDVLARCFGERDKDMPQLILLKEFLGSMDKTHMANREQDSYYRNYNTFVLTRIPCDLPLINS